MPRSILAHRPDANHAEIRDALRDIPGMEVEDTSAIGMSVDLLVVWRGVTGWVEIKNPDKATKPQKGDPLMMLTDSERKLRERVITAGGLHITTFDVESVLEQWPE